MNEVGLSSDDEHESRCLAAVEAVREIVTARAIFRSGAESDRLLRQHVLSDGEYLVAMSAVFIRDHMHDGIHADVAEDRFFYVLCRLGDLIQLWASLNDTPMSEVVLNLAQEDFREILHLGDGMAPAFEAAQSCLISHYFARRGRPPFGIQRNLDRDDMLFVAVALAEILVVVALGFPEQWHEPVVEVLLTEAEHILRCQARAMGVTAEQWILTYFDRVGRQG